MAYVSIPKDLTKVKNKVAFNLTKRQLICIGAGAAVGIPVYFLTRGVLGNSTAATVMILLMLPAFLFAMYEKDGMQGKNGFKADPKERGKKNQRPEDDCL